MFSFFTIFIFSLVFTYFSFFALPPLVVRLACAVIRVVYDERIMGKNENGGYRNLGHFDVIESIMPNNFFSLFENTFYSRFSLTCPFPRRVARRKENIKT